MRPRLLLALLLASKLLAEDEGGPKNRALTFQFLPPPVDQARYSIGVFDAKGVLVRRLHEGVAEEKLPAALNGLVVKWDAKDDSGKRVPNGKYELRGFALPPMKVTGVATKGNDWLADDPRLRVPKVELLGFTADGALLCRGESTTGERLTWIVRDGKPQIPTDAPAAPAAPATPWVIDEAGARQSPSGQAPRELPNAPNEPPLTAVFDDGANLLATTQFAPAANWQRTRMLKAAPDKGGWEPIFERNIRVPLAWPVAEAAATLDVELVRNPFVKRGRTNPVLTLRPVLDERGSHLVTESGLRLRTVSETRGLQAAALAPSGKKGAIRFFQRDAAVSEEFLVEGADKIMAFEVGRCELGEQGEIEQPEARD